jgi:hypothetical protein
MVMQRSRRCPRAGKPGRRSDARPSRGNQRSGRGGGPAPDPRSFLEDAADQVPGPIGDGIAAAAALDPETPAWKAADLLGNGQRVRASDTVPFALWSAAHHLDDLPGALWTTAEGLGDIDTTCAITAGVVAARTGLAGIPPAWLELAEPLPDWTQALTSA